MPAILPGPNTPLQEAKARHATRVTINGTFPVLASAPAVWSLRGGTAPVVEDFHVSRAVFDELKTLRGGTNQTIRSFTLEFDGPSGKLEFKHLVIVDFLPGPNEHIGVVRLADRRFFWSFPHILHRFNVRRRVGVWRAPDPVAELQPLVPDVQYARWSLQNPEGNIVSSRWTAEDVLRRVFKDLQDYEVRERIGLKPFGVAMAPNVGSHVRNLPVEDLELDDRGDQAMARVLSFLPGVGVFIDPEGDVIVYSRADFGERQVVVDAGPEIAGQGHVDVSFHGRRRPREIHVLFSFEVEVRFDYRERPSSGTVAVLTERLKEEQRRMDNVVAIPDFSLRVNNQTVHQGTWIEVDDVFTAWGNAPGIQAPLSHKIMRRASVPFMDLLAPFILVGESDLNVDWRSRVGSIRQHWRRTFRLPQRWVDRMQSLRAYRTSTVDVATGSRAPAHAFANYSMLVTQRSFFGIASQVGRTSTPHAINVDGFPAAGVIGDATRPIPAEVRVVDADQGIIELDFLADPARVFEAMLPGKIDNAPVEDLFIAGRIGTPVCFDAVFEGNAEFPELEDGWRCAVILTLIPGAPNTTRQLHKVIVQPQDVADLIPPAARAGLTETLGPALEVRVPPSIETARVRWDDGRALEIGQLFGINRAEDSEPPNVGNLIVNRQSRSGTAGGFGTPGASLENIARAIAARIYASLADRVIGNKTVDASADVLAAQPAGSLEEVTFEVTPRGDFFCHLRLPERANEFHIWSFLDDGTRAIIMRLVQGRKD